MDDYTWSTEKAHSNNTETMTDYLDNHMDSSWSVNFVDGSYAEVMAPICSLALHASGDGDFNHHRIRFEEP